MENNTVTIEAFRTGSLVRYDLSTQDREVLSAPPEVVYDVLTDTYGPCWLRNEVLRLIELANVLVGKRITVKID